MASKAIYSVVAVAGIAAASGAAWWYQNPTTHSSQSAVMSPSAASPAGGPGAKAGAKSPSVEVARVVQADLTDSARAVGSLRSRRGVVLRPEVGGRITRLNFTDGQRVRQGQLLVQLDDQLQQAQLQQSRAELSISQANQKRNQELVAQNFVSQRSLDESAANLQVAQAKLALAQATAARLRILAPFDGIVGIRQVHVGDYLKDGADIINLEDMDAIFVDYRLPERYQSQLRRGQTAVLEMDALPGHSYTAQIQAIDPLIDANGRSIGIRGCIDNRALQLRPGMFARVNTVFGARREARVIPEEAIVPQGGKQFVIKLINSADGKVPTTQRVEVKVGLRQPGQVEILQGLEPGETVVTAGQQRITRDGTAVNVLQLPASPAPELKSSSALAQKPAAPATPATLATPAGPNPCGPAVSFAPAAAKDVVR